MALLLTELKSFLEKRAKGGAGLIVVEAAYVHPSGRGMSHQLEIHNDQLIGGLKSLVDQTELARLDSIWLKYTVPMAI